MEIVLIQESITLIADIMSTFSAFLFFTYLNSRILSDYSNIVVISQICEIY